MSLSTARSTKVALPGLSAQVAVVVSACLVLLCCASGSGSHVQAAPVPIIIDTDIGIAMDDTWAIALILSRPDVFDVKLICTSTGNSTARARIVAKLLDEAGRTDIPIAIGSNHTTPRFGPPVGAEEFWADDYPLSRYPGTVYADGLPVFLSHLRITQTPVLILEIAPPVSLAAIIGIDPSAALNARVVAMSGSIAHGYLNTPGPDAEYNAAFDPAATALVYQTRWAAPMVTVPLDTSNFIQVGGLAYKSLLANANGKHPLVQALMASYRVFFEHGGGFKGLLPYNPLYRSTVLWDGLAAYAALELASLPDPFNPPVPAIGFTLNLQALHIRVNASGFTLPTNGSHQQVAVPLTMVADTFNATQELSVDLICGTIAGSLLIP